VFSATLSFSLFVFNLFVFNLLSDGAKFKYLISFAYSLFVYGRLNMCSVCNFTIILMFSSVYDICDIFQAIVPTPKFDAWLSSIIAHFVHGVKHGMAMCGSCLQMSPTFL